MATAAIRFYAELNDFLPPARRQCTSLHHFNGRVSIKDMLESLGVPHTEIALILINGAPADFDRIVPDGCRVAVYPPFRSLDIATLGSLQPPLPAEPRFVVDVHLGRLASTLRLLGFDTLLPADHADDQLAAIAAAEGRILLTRDQGLLKRRIVTWGYWVRSTNPRTQIFEVVRRFDLAGRLRPFQRCAHCNTPLQPVDKAAILDRLAPNTRLYYDSFQRCPLCDRLYWRGSHTAHLEQLIAEILRAANGER